MQSAEPTMETVMRPPAHTVTPGTPLNDARRLFIAETLRSLIVVDQNRPVGIVSWAEIGNLGEPAPGQKVADVMAPSPPAVDRATPLSTARHLLESTDHDLIPVVDQSGTLVGEAFRRELVKPDQPFAAEPGAQTASAPLVHSGMAIRNDAGDQLGTVDYVANDTQGRVTHLEVTTGRLIKNRTRIPFDLVSRIDGETVYVSLDKSDLKRLPEV
jgi:CBS domain-containing protein